MTSPPDYSFPPYQLHIEDARLYRDGSPLELRPKTFAVLRHLLERRGRLVTKRELLDTLWPDVAVGDAVLKGCIRELRQRLEDDADSPRYIKTAHRLGYRFIGKADTHGPVVAERAAVPAPEAGLCVGREHELALLEDALRQALCGRRQLCFVRGEPGAGKTTLLRTFMERACGVARVRQLVGQCVDQFGASEPYLPVLEALSRMSRERPDLRPLLEAHLTGEPDGASRAGSLGARTGSMLRSLADALEALAAPDGLVLALEDLHWSDHSTLALLSLLVSRDSPCRLLIIASHRVDEELGEALAKLTRELTLKQRASALGLPGLSRDGVELYLKQRLHVERVSSSLSALVHQHTAGNPMFVERVTDDLLRRAWLHVRAGTAHLAPAHDHSSAVPDALKDVLAHQLARVAPGQRRVLEVCATAGLPLSASILAEVLEQPLLQVEEDCEVLLHAPRALVQVAQEGERATRYAPVHALLASLVYSQVPRERAALLHGSLARVLARGTDAQRQESCHLLALHYERARDYPNAVQQLIAASERASRRFAPHEALTLARRGLSLLPMLTPTAASPLLELKLLLAVGQALIAVQGFGAEELVDTFGRARELAESVDDDVHRAHVLLGLRAYYAMRDLNLSVRLGQEVLALAEAREHTPLAIQSHGALGIGAFYLGDLVRAEHHYRLVDELSRELVAKGADPNTVPLAVNHARQGMVSQLRGHSARALAEMEQALAAAVPELDPFQRAWVYAFVAWLHLLRDEPAPAQELAERAIDLAEQDQFPYWEASSRVIVGWAQTRQGARPAGLESMRRGITQWRAIGSQVLSPLLAAYLSEALVLGGDRAAALRELELGHQLAAKTGELVFRSELLRLEAEFLAPVDLERSRALFDEAVAVARAQGAHGLALRVLASRVRVEEERGDARAAAASQSAVVALTRKLTAAEQRTSRRAQTPPGSDDQREPPSSS